MSIKKSFLIIFTFILILFSTRVFATEYYNIDNKDRSKIFEKAFNEWIETYKGENVPEEERIIGYDFTGWGLAESNVNRIRVTLSFSVTPFSENNIWRTDNMCFLEMTNVNGEYQVDYISQIPRNYDKFLERFNEYKLTAQTEEAKTDYNIDEQGIATNVSNTKIEQISNFIIIVCAILIILATAFAISKFLKVKSGKYEFV